MTRRRFPIAGRKISEKLYRKIHKVLPMICTDVVVVGRVKGKKYFLLVKRGNEPEKGRWWFPGGRIFKNELLREAAFRKVKQETGLVPTALKQIGLYEYFSPIGYYKGTNTHMLAVVHLAMVNARRAVMLDRQSTSSRWFRKIDPGWHPYLRAFLKKAGFR